MNPGVLIVDDVETNLLALSALLDGTGCEVVWARSGNEALRQLLRRQFAVLLLDVQMPEMDGYEVARHARSNPATQDVPIIFLTAAYNTEEHVLRGYGSGAVDFLFKPINPVILRSKVRIFLELFNGRRQIADANRALEKQNIELQNAYRELQNTQSQLVQSAKMASLGELVAGVAHEINNPLAFVISHLQTARLSLEPVRSEASEGPLSTAQRELLDRADNRLREMAVGLERIRELVVKLRTFSRLDEGELKRVSMRETIDSVLLILRHRLNDGIRVETHLADLDVIECYPSLLNQAIMNLVSNAIDAIQGPGTIGITTSVEADRYLIEVSDTGSGIPEELKDRVMEPFFTTKPVGEGTGLGLSITYSIVHKHGGMLDLTSRSGHGTTATIRIPLEATAEKRHANN